MNFSKAPFLEESVIGEVHQQSRGEPIVFAVFGLFVLAIMGLAYRRTRPENLVFSQAIVATLLLFAFFASFVDVIHGFSELIVVSGQQAVSVLFNMLEEGGELFALSSLVILCLWLSIGNARSVKQSVQHVILLPSQGISSSTLRRKEHNRW